MPNRRDVMAEQLHALADDLEALWRAATRDPKQEARRERAWMILSGALSAAATMGARQIVSRVWPILTGESAPSGPRPPKQAQSEERPRESTAA